MNKYEPFDCSISIHNGKKLDVNCKQRNNFQLYLLKSYSKIEFIQIEQVISNL